MEEGKKVCVTGGSGYFGSWMVMRLLQLGFSVNTTIRSHPDGKKDVSYLTNLPGAKERLHIYNADLDIPESFNAAVQGCIGVFHTAHPMNFVAESEETLTTRSINGILGILEACLNSKTVKRVVYTSSSSTLDFNSPNRVDESSWADVDLVRSLKPFAGSYSIGKTLTEKAAFEFAEKNGIDLVTVLPTWIHGPFVTPQIPGSVRYCMEMILGDIEINSIQSPKVISIVHVDDVTNAHIFLLDYPNATGRYICSAVEVTPKNLSEFLSTRYSEFRKQITEYKGTSNGAKVPKVTSKKLLETGFKYKYGLEEMYDGAIECCKQRSIL